MLQQLTIENFRGFKHLAISDFARFNIVAGENDVGKSSLLEAIFLLSGMEKSDIATYLSAARLVEATQIDDLFPIFYGKNIKTPVVVTGQFTDAVVRKIKLGIKPPEEREFRRYHLPNLGALSDVLLSPALVQSYQVGPSGQLPPAVELPLYVDQKGEIKTLSSSSSSHFWPCMYIPARKSLTDRRYLIDMINQKKKGDLLEILRTIDPQIADLTVNGTQVMVDTKYSDNLLPLEVLGDGLVRLVNILSIAEACRDGTICIDEIENGLHYTAMRTFWRALVKFARKGNIQVIATTHNLELMQNIAMATSEKETADLAYFRLVKRKDGTIAASRLLGASYKAQLEEGMELR